MGFDELSIRSVSSSVAVDMAPKTSAALLNEELEIFSPKLKFGKNRWSRRNSFFFFGTRAFEI